MRFLIDAQLPPALAPWLAAKGHPAQHVIDCGLEGAADRAVWDEAIRTGAVIVTKDEDFAMRRTLAVRGPCVVWVRLGNASRRETIRWFEAVLPTLLEALERGDTLVEVT
jgi:predicted nuclease of predicted toxin-antitoxin system